MYPSFVKKPSILVTSIATALLAVLPVKAAVLTWDIAPGTVGTGDSTITGGTGIWDTTLGNWTANGGLSDVTWVNANNDQAIFGGVAGTVTLGTAITANALTFNTTGYVLTGNPLALAGATPTITVGSGLSDTISSVLTGTAGLVVAGPGTLVLNSINTFSGGTTVYGGTLTLGAGGFSGTIRGALTINAGATVMATVNDALGYGIGSQISTVNINGGTFTTATNTNNGYATNFVLTGGSITESVATTGNAGLNFDGAAGFGVTTNASATTSTISARESIRTGNLTYTVAQGTTASGIDLNVTGVIFTNGGSGIIKNGPGTMAIGVQCTYAGGTTVNNGTLVLTGGGGAAGAIRGTATINAGATLRLATGDATGYNGGAASLNTINLNGGTLNVSTTANQTFGSATVNMTGATVSGIAASNIDLFGNGTVINTLASPTTSTISIPRMNLRQDNTQFNVTDGAAGTDLLVSSILGNGAQGNHNLIKNGAGTMLLTGVNTYTGNTTVNAGTFALSGAAALPSTVVTIASGGVFDVSALPAGNFTVASGKSLVAGSTSVFANDVVGNVVNSSGAINIAGTGVAGTLTIGGNLTLNSGAVNFDLANVTTVGSGVNDLAKVVNLTLTGTTSLVINKLTGALVSSGTYTLFNYSGTLTGNQSNLTLSGAAGGTTRQTFALNTVATPGSILLTVSGSAANLVWVGDGAANAWDIASTVNWTGAADLNNKYYDGDQVTISDAGSNVTPIALATTVQPSSLTVNNPTKDYTISGAGNIAGLTGLTKSGNGKLTIGTTNSFAGAVAINAGTVSVATLANTGANSGLGAGAGITLGDASNLATLQYTGATAATNRAITVGDVGARIDVSNAAAILTTTGAISGAGSLTKVGNGALTVNSVISIGGSVTVNAGVLTLLNAQSTYTGGTTVNSGATLTLTGADSAVGVIRGALTVNAGGIVNTTTSNVLGYGGGTKLDTLNLLGSTLNNTAVGNQGWGLAVNLTNGTLQSNGGVSDVASTQLFSLGGGSSVNSFASAMPSIISGRVHLRESNVNDRLPFNIEDGAAAVDLNVTAAITGNAATRGLTKNGAGLLLLSGANTYTGTTAINEGTLALGSAATMASSLVTVAAGAIFDVSAVSGGYTQATGRALTIAEGGLLAGSATFAAGATLTGGRTSGFSDDVSGAITSSGTINIVGSNTPGTFTFGNALTLSGGTVAFDLANDTTAGNGTNDLINVAGGSLILSGTTTIAVNPYNGSLVAGSYTLFNYAGALTGNASNFALTGVVATGRRTYTFDTTTTIGSVLLKVTAGTPVSLIWTGAGANPWDLSTAIWNNAGNADKYYDLDDVTFNDAGSNTPNVTINTTLQPGSLSVNSATKNYTFSGSGTIAGSTGLTKNGASKLTISTTNTFTGAIVINNGTVSVPTIANGGVNSPLGTGTTITLGDAANIGTLQYTGATAGTNRPFALGDGGGGIDVATAGTALTVSGLISGNGGFTKSGNGELVLTNAGNNFAGNVIINGGKVTAATYSGGDTGVLGLDSLAGRIIAVNNGATLSLTVNNIFGNGVGNPDMPAIILNGSTLTSTRYNAIGSVTLIGGTLTQASSDADGYEGYQFIGDITVGGSTPSTISSSNGKGNHLGTNTIFDVANVTGNSATDLTISAPILSQSPDLGGPTSALTKIGNGTVRITGAQSYDTLNQEAGRTILDTSLADATINADGGSLILNANANNSTVNVSNTTSFTVNQTLAALNIGDGGSVEITSFAPPSLAAAAVPEPGTLSLLLGAVGLLARRRRR